MNRAILPLLFLMAFAIAGTAQAGHSADHYEAPVMRGIVAQLDGSVVFTKMPEGKIDPATPGTVIEALHAVMLVALAEAGKGAEKRGPQESDSAYRKRRDEIFSLIDNNFRPSDLFFFMPGKDSEIPDFGVTYDAAKKEFSAALPAADEFTWKKMPVTDQEYGPGPDRIVLTIIHRLRLDQTGLSPPSVPAGETLKPGDLRAGYLVNLRFPYIAREMARKRPAADSPAETTIKLTVFAHLRRVLLYRADTGEIVAQKDY